MNQKKTDTSLLEIRKVVREYILPRQQLFSSAKRFRALDGVSLTINSGESFGIVGESGCGKSTLARTVMALEAPQSGEICFQGKILHALKAKDLRRVRSGLQMIFQDPYGSLDPRQSVGKIIAEPLSLLGKMTLKKRSEMVTEALDNVGLSPNDSVKFPHEFSGGQRQRIAIARALITRPALIVADEPVSALDVSVQAQVLNLMMDLRDRHGLAYLFISHDLSIVRHMTTKVAVMYAGRIVEQGPTQMLFDHAQHPYTRALLAAVPRTDPSRKKSKSAASSVPKIPDSNFETLSGNGCAYASRCPLVEDKCRNISPALQNIQAGSATGFENNPQEIKHKVACYKPYAALVKS
ncbi:ATP-binding cassette domain-containing protein [bacterium]|jgi:oligopeptide/dipeptide ABC transporter ATP-binding protein|nr:ABC transporter ATP-binding protein [Deltaproteobacteria bacterium]MDB3917592.1 ATP-binding cassette domain-containing protein [bacterium]